MSWVDSGSRWAFVPFRIFLGLAMMTHGFPKIFDAQRAAKFAQGVAEMGFPAPTLFANLAGLSELLGGLLLALGLLTRPAALAIVGTMFVAAFVRHAGDPFAKKELALMFLFGGLAFALHGGGPLSLGKRFASLRRWS